MSDVVDDLKREHGDDKVQFTAICIDQTDDELLDLIMENGWDNMQHYHQAESKWNDDYKIQGIPTVMLVDTNGKIAFLGHPAYRESFQDDIQNLLNNEVLKGDGCQN